MRVRFPNLDGLRFFAALAVAIAHVEQVSSIFKLPNVYHVRAIAALGNVAVSVFFVLSGFLITYLLLAENEKTGTINFYNFYRRRALRILPLYLSICVIAFFVIPHVSWMSVPGYQPPWTNSFWLSAGLYALLSPHVAESLLPGIPYAGVLWSVGVEEWFYFICPALLFFAGRRSATILVSVALLLVLGRWAPGRLAAFFLMLRFDCLAVGGLFAMLLVYSAESKRLTELRQMFYARGVQIVVLCMLPLTLVLMDHIAQAVVFGIFIFNLATNPKSLLSLAHPILDRLGAISYGMYGYNWIAAVIAMRVATMLFRDTLAASAATFIGGIVLTLLLAGLSYLAIEKPFLDLKWKKRERTVPLLVPD